MELSGHEEQRRARALGYRGSDQPKVHVVREVGEAELTGLLVEGTVPLVIENYVTDRLSVIARDRRFEFWKRELKPRLVGPGVRSFDREGFPGGSCYTALLCEVGSAGDREVLCRMHH